ncbi:MAG: arginine--tRNA ligase [Gammaproteobacteria bacterium]|nr:arginine--tRNA ligase [Gammaproteobacteria bacterium]
MKQHLQQLVTQAIRTLQQNGTLPGGLDATPLLERCRDPRHGDFACNNALMLGKAAKQNPRQLAEKLIAALPTSDLVAKIEIAGPGFINFTLKPEAYQAAVTDALDQGNRFGRSSVGAGKSIQVEFVSANPTGPLHVGHGRGAAYGATVANLLAAVGFNVHREYYVNDAGRQMDILGTSIWLRYLEQCGEKFTFPSNGYKGEYVREISGALYKMRGITLRHFADEVFADIPADEPQGGDKEIHIDALVARAKNLLGASAYREVFDLGLDTVLADIRQDLEEFGVTYDQWYSEHSLTESNAVERTLQRLRDNGFVYEKDGAQWFRSTEFGDEKDRVVVRENGQITYFASDIAYHMDKMERGFERVIDIWGADHHGYVPRVKGALKALGDNPDKLDVLLVQFAILYRGGERVQMSTRSGQFVTLRELRAEVGNDAARFFYVMRKCEQHMDFDLDLAKSQSSDNPVYYIQYAHARVCSVLRQLTEKGFSYDAAQGRASLHLLHEAHEQTLMMNLSRYSEILEMAALNHEPHQLAHYLRDLANDFHVYYNSHQFLVDEAALRNARLTLIQAVRQTIKNGLELLGVSAPESM